MQPLIQYFKIVENQQILTNPIIIYQNRWLDSEDKGTTVSQILSNCLPRILEI